MQKAQSFEAFGEIDIVVISQNHTCGKEANCVDSPEEAVRILTEKGHTEIVVAGGSTINGLFVESNLIDEIRLDVEPVIFERGLPLFITTIPTNLSLTLLSTEKVGTDGIHLHYAVQK
jgi:dihydrofolate reductase